MSVSLMAQTNADRSLPQYGSEPKDGAIYKLFPTDNIWTFIKLDTRNGLMWQVQFYVGKKEGYRYEQVLSAERLIDFLGEKNGRYTLYPTDNIYNFLLLDQIDGRVWQVQWSTKEEERMIIKIN